MNALVLNDFPAFRGLLPTAPFREALRESGERRAVCPRPVKNMSVGSQGGECSLSRRGEGYQKVNVLCLWGFIFFRFILLPQGRAVFYGEARRLWCALQGSCPISSSSHHRVFPALHPSDSLVFFYGSSLCHARGVCFSVTRCLTSHAFDKLLCIWSSSSCPL